MTHQLTAALLWNGHDTHGDTEIHGDTHEDTEILTEKNENVDTIFLWVGEGGKMNGRYPTKLYNFTLLSAEVLHARHTF